MPPGFSKAMCRPASKCILGKNQMHSPQKRRARTGSVAVFTHPQFTSTFSPTAPIPLSMSSAPRTKPWEVSSGTSSAAATGDALPHTAAPIADTNIPDRPLSLSADYNAIQNLSSYGLGYGSSGYGSRYGVGGYGSSMGLGYGSGMYGGGYGSSMYGMGLGYGSSMYGGMGGYGSSMYGGYGSGMYGGMGMGGPQGPGGLAEGTQATFQLIESIIGAVGGFAQMLEATYMATHSSFFTMVSLAEQFGNLKNALGSLLGIFAIIKFVKKMFYKVTGKTYNYGLNMKEFTKFEKKQKRIEDGLRKQHNPKRISFKPLLLFLAASIGFPYLLSKAIQKLNAQQQQRRLSGAQNPQGLVPQGLDPSSLQFAKALYEFNPENPNIEIELTPNELVAILSKKDPMGNDSKWWKVRSRAGKVGYVPMNYLSIIERKQQQLPQSAPQQEGPLPVEVAPVPATNEKAFSYDEFKKLN